MIIREYGNENSKKLLFFQSTGEPWWAFKESVELLAQNYLVFQVAPDGHDPEEKSDFVSIEKTVDDVTAWLKEKGVNCLDAVYGLSMGGGCAMRLIAEKKIRVDKAMIDGGTAPSILSDRNGIPTMSKIRSSHISISVGCIYNSVVFP